MTERNNPFADLAPTNLADEFKPKPPTRESTVDRKAIDQIAAEHDFPSRRPGQGRAPKRRNATGRNQQINIKTTAEAIALFYALADRKGVPLGKVFEDGLAALEREGY
ncbi:hypothetical protein [Caballeronia telluris]|uniref:Stability/partitioning determinant n=1 Tax=Caballeronia telluris TaxID=326475 RepID=A0A158KGA4_9BURK|nr:hypothetical protein [Caballeronia telluris]SAL80162.1 hypothetical protein AWB66_06192 [Caballeronia telluris]